MRGELLEAERVHSIVAAFFTVYNYFRGGGSCEAFFFTSVHTPSSIALSTP